MSKVVETKEEKTLDRDLWIIFIATGVVYAIFAMFNKQICEFMNNSEVSVLLRVITMASFQFGMAGLGISIVCIIRKQRFSSFGLRKKGALLSIVLCSLCFVPHILFLICTNQFTSYLPFQEVWITRTVLNSQFPVNLIGMLFIAAAWGFFEGFNYVVITDKITQRYPSKNRWLNWGAIGSAIMCILIHGAVGVTPQDFIEMLTIIVIIYGMLQVKEYTKNAWGCVFVFMFLWNAI